MFTLIECFPSNIRLLFPLSIDINFTFNVRDAIRLITQNLFFHFYFLNGHIFLNMQGKHKNIRALNKHSNGVNMSQIRLSLPSFLIFLYILHSPLPKIHSTKSMLYLKNMRRNSLHLEVSFMSCFFHTCAQNIKRHVALEK